MEQSEQRIVQEALRLPVQARAALASTLIESLDEEVDAAAEAEWSEEIARRLHELDSGTVKTIPWAEVIAVAHAKRRPGYWKDRIRT